MVYTRSSQTVSAARTLLTMKTYRVPVATVSTVATVSDNGPTEAQLWSNWTAWYHTFVSEVLDESHKGNRFTEAESRWSTFCSKKLRCDEKYVQSWLKHSNVTTRMTLAGF